MSKYTKMSWLIQQFQLDLDIFRSAKISSEAVNFSQAMTCNSHITFTNEKRKKTHIKARAHLTSEYYIYIKSSMKRNQRHDLATLRWEGFLVVWWPTRTKSQTINKAHSLLSQKINKLNIYIPTALRNKKILLRNVKKILS